MPAHHVCEISGTPTTTLSRSVVDIARSASMLGAVVVGEAALRRGSPQNALVEMLDECSPSCETKKAAAAIDFFDARSESALESLSRVLMHANDIPPPEPQYWEHKRLVGEADGKVKYSGTLNPGLSPEEVVWREKLREDDLRDAGFGIVRWTYAQMLNETDRTIGRIRRGLAS